MTTTEKSLCAECGAAVSAGCCIACGHVADGADAAHVPSDHTDVAWARAARATLVFLAFQVLLRGAVVAMGDGGVRTHLMGGALGIVVILGVYRGLTQRSELVLAVWSWLSAFAALVLAVGAGLWWAFGAPGVVRMALTLTAAVWTAAYAWVLRRVAATLDGR